MLLIPYEWYSKRNSAKMVNCVGNGQVILSSCRLNRIKG